MDSKTSSRRAWIVHNPGIAGTPDKVQLIAASNPQRKELRIWLVVGSTGGAHGVSVGEKPVVSRNTNGFIVGGNVFVLSEDIAGISQHVLTITSTAEVWAIFEGVRGAQMNLIEETYV